MKRMLIGVFSFALLIGFSVMAMAWGGKNRGGGPGYCYGYGSGPGWMDSNRDGKVSNKEWEKHHHERFSAMDTNKDGVVDEKEFRNYGPRWRDR